MDLSNDPSYWLPLSSLYLEIELRASALHAFEQVLAHNLDVSQADAISELIIILEDEISHVAQELDLPIQTMKQGLRDMEKAQVALHNGDYQACIRLNHIAIEILGDWPPPHNNLSMALFYDGQPEQAIATAQQVLVTEPHNLQAFSNIIRYLVWTGHKKEGQKFWTQLQPVEPHDLGNRLKKAEAAAVLGEDETVYELLIVLEETEVGPDRTAATLQQVQVFLAVAEANTNRHSSAKRRLKRLKRQVPHMSILLSALQKGQSGPGYSSRFPYYHSTDLMTRDNMEVLIELVSQQEKLPEQDFRQQIDEFVARFPQIVLTAEKLIWEEDQLMAGISLLEIIGSSAAYAALERFATSQVGDDDIRMEAVMVLSKAGQLSKDKPLRIWRDGRWEETLLRSYELIEEPDENYTNEVWEALERAQEASRKGDDVQAERLFKQVLKLNPQVKEAYNNLGALYSKQGDKEQAKAMLEAALEIEPLYIFPRANLANFLLNDGDVEGAEEVLKPLANLQRFHPQEMVYYTYIQARVLFEKEEYEAVRNSLRMALEINPDYEPASNLLHHLETHATTLDLFAKTSKWQETYMARQEKRDKAKRTKLQTQLTSSNPTLSEALSIYTKDQLTGMARQVIWGGGWSGLKKADLCQRIIEDLKDQNNLSRVFEQLTTDEREALKDVLSNDGAMLWADFDEQYGNDLDESPYWQWHTPETAMGRLRLRGLLAEVTVEKQLRLVIPTELRVLLDKILT